MNGKIAIIGAGNLGRAIAAGIVEKGVARAADITLTRRDTRHLLDLKEKGFGTTADNIAAVQAADVVLLCVQPHQLSTVIAEIKSPLSDDKLLISVITGVSIAQVSTLTGGSAAVVRAMPNTAIATGESMTCIASTDREGLEVAMTLFDALGKTLIIEESLMQAATVLGASGIAFFMRYLRAATQGGVQMGFDSDEAQLIAVQTAKGAAALVQHNESHPEVEIDKVTTPQGCTIEGLNEMEHQGFSSALIRGIMTSFYRITKMKNS